MLSVSRSLHFSSRPSEIEWKLMLNWKLCIDWLSFFFGHWRIFIHIQNAKMHNSMQFSSTGWVLYVQIINQTLYCNFENVNRIIMCIIWATISSTLSTCWWTNRRKPEKKKKNDHFIAKYSEMNEPSQRNDGFWPEKKYMIWSICNSFKPHISTTHEIILSKFNGWLVGLMISNERINENDMICAPLGNRQYII